MTKQKEVEESGSCWLCPTETKNKWKDLHINIHHISNHFLSINIENGKALWFRCSFLDLFFSKVNQMLKHVVEITTLHNKSSPQCVMIGYGFSDTFYSSVLSQFGSWLPLYVKATGQMLNQHRNGIKAFVSMTCCSVCWCRCGTWQTHCLETVGDKATRGLFHRPLNLPPSRRSGNKRAERRHEVGHMQRQFNNFNLHILRTTIRQKSDTFR